ncbi:hypothetical protein [Maioricimonas rarisocia]|nr:hypothetical protein [Maioricimonas rarisocia]
MNEREFQIAYRQTLIDGDLAERCRLLIEAGLICVDCGEWLGDGFVGQAARCGHCSPEMPGGVRPQRGDVSPAVPNPVSTSV